MQYSRHLIFLFDILDLVGKMSSLNCAQVDTSEYFWQLPQEHTQSPHTDFTQIF